MDRRFRSTMGVVVDSSQQQQKDHTSKRKSGQKQRRIMESKNTYQQRSETTIVVSNTTKRADKKNHHAKNDEEIHPGAAAVRQTFSSTRDFKHFYQPPLSPCSASSSSEATTTTWRGSSPGIASLASLQQQQQLQSPSPSPPNGLPVYTTATRHVSHTPTSSATSGSGNRRRSIGHGNDKFGGKQKIPSLLQDPSLSTSTLAYQKHPSTQTITRQTNVYREEEDDESLTKSQQQPVSSKAKRRVMSSSSSMMAMMMSLSPPPPPPLPQQPTTNNNRSTHYHHEQQPMPYATSTFPGKTIPRGNPPLSSEHQKSTRATAYYPETVDRPSMSTRTLGQQQQQQQSPRNRATSGRNKRITRTAASSSSSSSTSRSSNTNRNGTFGLTADISSGERPPFSALVQREQPNVVDVDAQQQHYHDETSVPHNHHPRRHYHHRQRGGQNSFRQYDSTTSLDATELMDNRTNRKNRRMHGHHSSSSSISLPHNNNATSYPAHERNNSRNKKPKAELQTVSDGSNRSGLRQFHRRASQDDDDVLKPPPPPTHHQRTSARDISEAMDRVGSDHLHASPRQTPTNTKKKRSSSTSTKGPLERIRQLRDSLARSGQNQNESDDVEAQEERYDAHDRLQPPQQPQQQFPSVAMAITNAMDNIGSDSNHSTINSSSRHNPRRSIFGLFGGGSNHNSDNSRHTDYNGDLINDSSNGIESSLRGIDDIGSGFAVGIPVDDCSNASLACFNDEDDEQEQLRTQRNSSLAGPRPGAYHVQAGNEQWQRREREQYLDEPSEGIEVGLHNNETPESDSDSLRPQRRRSSAGSVDVSLLSDEKKTQRRRALVVVLVFLFVMAIAIVLAVPLSLYVRKQASESGSTSTAPTTSPSPTATPTMAPTALPWTRIVEIQEGVDSFENIQLSNDFVVEGSSNFNDGTGRVRVLQIASGENNPPTTTQVGQDFRGMFTKHDFGKLVSLSDTNRLAMVTPHFNTSRIDFSAAQVLDLVDGSWQPVGDTVYAQLVTPGSDSDQTLFRISDMSLSANGEVLAFASERKSDGEDSFLDVFEWTNSSWQHRAHLMDFHYNMKLDLSVDGRLLAYGGGRGLTGVVRVTFFDGSRYNTIAQTPVEGGVLQALSVSKDGSALSFASHTVVRVANVVAASADGEEPARLDWRPDLPALRLLPGLTVDTALSDDGEFVVIAWTADEYPVHVRILQWMPSTSSWTNRGSEVFHGVSGNLATPISVSISGSRLGVACYGTLRIFELPEK